MDTTDCISTWTVLLQQFFPAFTTPGAQVFLALIRGWVLCTARRTITGILPFADPKGQHAHDAFHRFLPDGRWDMNVLWKLLTILLVKTFGPREPSRWTWTIRSFIAAGGRSVARAGGAMRFDPRGRIRCMPGA